MGGRDGDGEREWEGERGGEGRRGDGIVLVAKKRGLVVEQQTGLGLLSWGYRMRGRMSG